MLEHSMHLSSCRLHTCLPPCRVIVVVDRPVEQLGQAELSWLQQAQLEMLPRLRVRVNGTNRVSLIYLTAGCWGSRYGQPPDVRTQPVDCTTRRDVARNANQPLPCPRVHRPPATGCWMRHGALSTQCSGMTT